MSEKIYAWLLRLYPSRFREAYGAEALQLFRDRARDEKGFLPGLRLWLDLLADLAISVPREYRSVHPALIGASTHPGSDGLPSFCVLESELPRFGALLFGGVVSLIALCAVAVLVNGLGTNPPYVASIAQPQPAASERSSALKPPAAHDGSAAREAASRQLASAASPLRPGDVRPSNFQPEALESVERSGIPPSQVTQPKPHSATSTAAHTVGEDMKLDAAERQHVIDGTIANLKQYYVYPDVAQKMADALLAHEKSGDDRAETDGEAFADLLTRQMRDVSHDRQLELLYSRALLPEHPAAPTAEGLARYRKAMEQENCMFEKVEVLPHNIGYLKLNFFPDTSVCQSKANAAMASLNHADAIIFDLRDNTGGFPDMVALIASYLFDHPEYMFNPREAPTQQSWTLSPVPGNKLADKPAYVLISAKTISGGEEFSYDLKMLKRATLVGETTGGAAHAGVWHRIDDHFGMDITETKAINPFSKTDWEGTGVEPHVKVKAADALETAEKLAEAKLQKK